MEKTHSGYKREWDILKIIKERQKNPKTVKSKHRSWGEEQTRLTRLMGKEELTKPENKTKLIHMSKQ